MAQTTIANLVVEIAKIEASFLNNFINDFNNTYKAAIYNDPENNEHFCADAALANILKTPAGFPDLQVTKDNKLNKIGNINSQLLKKYNPKFMHFLQTKFPNCSIVLAGEFVYPKNGYMGWHTNANTPYLRCYMTYSENGDSYFKYRDPYTKEIVVSKDDIGWTMRYFKISDRIDELLWHCVYSNTTRISLGYRIINNLT